MTQAISSQFEETTVGESNEMPGRIVVYGRGKIGKSKFASEFPDVFFLNIENGLRYLPNKVRATPHLKDFDSIIAWLKHIYDNEKFTAEWICIDSLDWAEELAQAKLVKINNAKSITDSSIKDFAYFRGVIAAAEETAKILRWLDAIEQKKGIKSIIIAHSILKEVDLPNKNSFSRYQLKLSKYLSAKTMEWCDMLLMAEHDFHVTSDGTTSEPKPMLFTGGDAFYEGGGRIKLPRAIAISYDALENSILEKKS